MSKLKLAKRTSKLKLKLWQELIYLAFVLLGPVIITAVELFQSHSTALKISFASIGALLITLIVIKKIFIANKIDKIKQKIVMLEHDYSIGVGDAEACRRQWAIQNLFIFAYNAICAIIALVLLVLFVNAICEGLIAFKGAALLILLFAIIGCVFKMICYLVYAKLLIAEESENVEENINSKY